jgi:hypothetical protein
VRRESGSSSDGGKIIVDGCLGSDRVSAVGVITYCSGSLCGYTCGSIAWTWGHTREVVCSKINSDEMVGWNITVGEYFPCRLLVDAPELQAGIGIAGVGQMAELVR